MALLTSVLLYRCLLGTWLGVCVLAWGEGVGKPIVSLGEVQILLVLYYHFFLLVLVVGTLSLEPNDLTIVRDQVAAFECLVTNAVPPTVVTWYNDSKPVKTNSRVVVSAGTLFIKNVQDSDEGSYHCEAGNIAGNLTSRAASLTVIDLNTTGMTACPELHSRLCPN